RSIMAGAVRDLEDRSLVLNMSTAAEGGTCPSSGIVPAPSFFSSAATHFVTSGHGPSSNRMGLPFGASGAATTFFSIDKDSSTELLRNCWVKYTMLFVLR